MNINMQSNRRDYIWLVYRSMGEKIMCICQGVGKISVLEAVRYLIKLMPSRKAEIVLGLIALVVYIRGK